MQFFNQPDGSSDGQDFGLQIADVPEVLSIVAAPTPTSLSHNCTGFTSFVRIWIRFRENQPEDELEGDGCVQLVRLRRLCWVRYAVSKGEYGWGRVCQRDVKGSWRWDWCC
jgi:hypothetical protein